MVEEYGPYLYVRHRFVIDRILFKILHSLKGGVFRCSSVKCLTRNQRILGSSGTESSGLYLGATLGKTLQSLQPSTGETQEY